MAGPLKLHRSYNFSVVDEIRTLIQDSGEPIEHIAHSAGVSARCIHLWLNGKTRKPYATSVEKVARALGKRLSLVENELRLVDPLPAPPLSMKRREPLIAWNWRRDH